MDNAISQVLKKVGNKAVNEPVLPFAPQLNLKNLFTRSPGTFTKLDPGSLYGAYKQDPMQTMKSSVMALSAGPSAKKMKFSPSAYSMHPEDQKELINIVGKLQAKQTLSPQQGIDLQRLADHYLGKNYSTSSNKVLSKIFDRVLERLGTR